VAQIDSLRTEEKFKKTEVGEIPVDWGAMRLSEIGEIITGSTPSTKNRDYYNGKYMFVTPFDMGDFKYVTKTAIMLSEAGMSVSKSLPRNTVMVTCIASIGKIAMASAKCCTNQQINSVICQKSTDSHFVYYVMQTKINTLKALAGQTAVPIVKKSLFSNIPIPLPSLSEQKKITEILSTVDQAVEKSNEIIEKTKKLKKGLIQELLTRGIGHKKFKKTEIGEIPVEWGAMRLSEIGEIVTGSTPSTKNRDYYSGKYMFVTPFDMGDFKHVTKTAIMLSEEGMNVSRRLPRDTVMVTCIASIGKIAMASAKCCTNQQINSIICNKKTDPHFVYYTMQTKINTLKALAGQTAVPIVKKSLFSSVPIPLPSLPEQKKIAEILSIVDEEIEEAITQKEKLENIKKGLMQVLLTGKVRVRVGL